jgi:hypothetical protein
MEISQKTKDISRGNDIFRNTMSGRVVVTSGVESSFNRNDIIQRVKLYGDFNDDNDPYGEHNFGAFDIDETRYFWKIDYYSPDMEFGADPYETSVFERVLTIMRADEY